MERLTRKGTKAAKAANTADNPAAAPAATPPAAATAATAAAADKDAANELTVDEVKGVIGETVKANLAELLAEQRKDLGDMVNKAIEQALANRGQQPITADQVKAVAMDATKTVLDSVRADRKAAHDPTDAQRPLVEIPWSWCKGNLPVHGKQLANILLRRPVNDGIRESDLEEAVKRGDAMISRLQYGTKLLTSTGSGTGDELVPADLSAELQRRMYMASSLYALLSAQEVQMPTQPYMLPISTTRPTFYFESTEGQSATESTPGTGNVTLDAKKFMAKVAFSYEINEDSIVPILPWIERLLGEAAADCFESALINGDDSATHMDSDTNAIAKAAEKAFKGLRKYALAQTATKKDLSTGGISAANLRAMLKQMKKYAVRTQDLLLVCGIAGKNDLLGLSEVMTVDKAGNFATLFGSPLPAIWGVTIVDSARCREDLNASGVYDGTTTTKGSILFFNRTQFILGRRRDFMVEAQQDIDTQTTKVVASFRRAFVPLETPSSTVTSLCIGYNYTA